MAQSLPMLEWQDVGSTNVKSIAYHNQTRTLLVQFNNGGLYSYSDVDMDVYVDMAHAESVGSYLNQMIKGRYAYLKWFNEGDLVSHLNP